MPLHNRVTPFGEVVAVEARGSVYGNRGCLHDETGRIRRSYNGQRWISCRLDFKGRRRHPLMRPGRFTELFFLDEATAFAAGHRPCAECRREDYVRFTDMWRERHPHDTYAGAIDERLHDERFDVVARAQRHHTASIADLPDGTFIARDGNAMLVAGNEIRLWTPAGYTEKERRPSRRSVEIITPPSIVDVLRAGWISSVPFLHPSALSLPT